MSLETPASMENKTDEIQQNQKEVILKNSNIKLS